LGTYIAQILEVVQLSNYPNTKESKSFQLMRVVVIVIGLIILISIPFYGFLEDDDWLENVLEWNITFLIFFYFILSGVLWRTTTLRMEIQSDTN
jgi:NADH:ubiquinone oxidoreductase subunit 5 (subunit L)/multisubunit Na+/H+ antiporter MnhA subunit